MLETDLELMARNITTGFHVDDNGRLRSVNEPGDAYAPPRFFLGRTPDGNIWRFRYDLPDWLATHLDEICRAEPVMGEPGVETPGADTIRAALQAHAPIQNEERGPTFVILEQPTVPTEAILIDETNVEVLQKLFPWRRPLPTNFEIGPFAGTIVDGNAVSLCWCSRLSASGASAGVETIEAFRGRGYAAQAV